MYFTASLLVIISLGMHIQHIFQFVVKKVLKALFANSLDVAYMYIGRIHVQCAVYSIHTCGLDGETVQYNRCALHMGRSHT